MHAFSVGYPGQPATDERADARALANYLGMPFYDVELTTSDMVSFFSELNYWRDDPIADIAGYGYYAVMKLAREHSVPVVLQGQGGDELFWGYDWVRDAAKQTARKHALRQKGVLSALPQYLTPQAPTCTSRYELWQWARRAGGLRPGWRSFRRDRGEPEGQFVFLDLLGDFRSPAEELPELYTPSFREQLNGSNTAELFTFADPWPDIDITITRLICDTYLRENGVTQGDRLSMASSIELRLPLLDHRLAETVIGLRKTQSDATKPAKAWLKTALEDVLPDWVVNRPKRGFTPPVRQWHDALFSVCGDSLRNGYLVQARVLKPKSGELLAEGSFPQEAITPLSFKALVLELWCRQLLAVCSSR
jgi:asparagine synthase (glutamine-hydrolysing)